MSRGIYGKMATKREKERDRIEERKGFVARFTTFGKRIGDCRVNSGRKSRERDGNSRSLPVGSAENRR